MTTANPAAVMSAIASRRRRSTSRHQRGDSSEYEGPRDSAGGTGRDRTGPRVREGASRPGVFASGALTTSRGVTARPSPVERRNAR